MEPDEFDQMRAALQRVVAIGNGKGGTYKTSLAANISGLAADSGMRVLLIDLDPQANLSEELGLTQDGRDVRAGDNLFDGVARDKPLVPSHPDIRKNLDLIAGDYANTSSLASHFGGPAASPDSVFSLARALQPIAPQYDLVVLDLPPGNEPLIRLAMAAARYLIIPTQPDSSSIKGLRVMAKRFTDARSSTNPDLELLGVVGVGLPAAAKKMKKSTAADIHAVFGGNAPLFETTIRHAISPAKDARGRGLLVHELEAFVPTKAEAIERLRQRAAGAQVDDAVSGTAIKLAGDYAGITQEIFSEIQKREAQV
jgi:chromosome partitioning protein